MHESVALTSGEPGMLRHDAAALPYRDISHHLATIDRYTTLAAEQMARRRPRAVDRRPRAASAVRVPAQLRAARRLPPRRRRLRRVGAELVLRVSETGEGVGVDRTRESRRDRSSRRVGPRSPAVQPRSDVLPPHRHRADVARRPEPGAAHRARAARARPSDDAGRARRPASCGSGRRKGSI